MIVIVEKIHHMMSPILGVWCYEGNVRGGLLETLHPHLHFLLQRIRRQSNELFGEIRATA